MKRVLIALIISSLFVSGCQITVSKNGESEGHEGIETVEESGETDTVETEEKSTEVIKSEKESQSVKDTSGNPSSANEEMYSSAKPSVQSNVEPSVREGTQSATHVEVVPNETIPETVIPVQKQTEIASPTIPETTIQPTPAPPATTLPVIREEPTTEAPTEPPTTVAPTTAAPETQAPIDTAAYAVQVIALVNAERAANGLPALTVHPGLMQAAKIRSDECTVLFDHNRPNERPTYELITDDIWLYGETLHMGGGPEVCVKGWISSTMHHGIMLSEGQYIGVGCSERSDGVLVYSALYAEDN